MKNISNVLRGAFGLLALGVLGFIFMLYSVALLEPVKVMAVTDEVVITQTVTSGITISDGSAINLTALTLTQDTAVGDTSWTVITNNQAGYTLTIKASAAPALKDNTTLETFADYSSPGTWSVSSAYEFGWSAYGNNVTGYGTDTETNCIEGADVPSAGLLWKAFTVAEIQMASSTSETAQAGTVTTMCVATEQETVFAPSGTYYATTTATAIVQ